jgi:hypothetical protein
VSAEVSVGQVREYAPDYLYVVVSVGNGVVEALYIGGPCAGELRDWSCLIVKNDPIVGWSREHTPPPKRTMDPREIVTGDVRNDCDNPADIRIISAVLPTECKVTYASGAVFTYGPFVVPHSLDLVSRLMWGER